MNEFEMEKMMGDVVFEAANAPVPAGLEQRLKRGVFAEPDLENGLLTFASMGLADRMVGRETRKTVWGALALHAAALLLLMVQVRAMHDRREAPLFVESEVELVPPPVLPPSAKAAGGGGGHEGAAPVARGAPPKFAEKQLMPPEIHPVEDAKLPVETTVSAQVEMQAAPMPQLGMPNAPSVGVGLGGGHGAGIGPGDGDGIGPGGGGGVGGGGLHTVGGTVSEPKVLYAPEPEFSEEARKAKFSGNVLVYLQVDRQGHPMHVRVLRGVGMGLDEHAVAAVRQYRFRPAMENGLPVAVEMNVEVVFQIE